MLLAANAEESPRILVMLSGSNNAFQHIFTYHTRNQTMTACILRAIPRAPFKRLLFTIKSSLNYIKTVSYATVDCGI